MKEEGEGEEKKRGRKAGREEMRKRKEGRRGNVCGTICVEADGAQDIMTTFLEI